ncbi:leucine-rich repeat domain-containing protein [uncultured Duncaniella sp.]|uniref:leucine-rich repeat domain-containing protein n=1 Tax=uncultured Duncaniella sp. TaxID=2768039 RepID=UPI0025D10214|nr:leucine-rich repeat domain-containing protein [uncultured Duncaniella sp.]
MKKVLLSLLGVLIALPGISRDFSYTYEGQKLKYTVIDEEAKTCKTKEGDWAWMGYQPGNNVSGELIIPEIAMDGDTGYTVTSLSKGAFFYCSGLRSVTFPESLTSIGDEAFYGCSSLTLVKTKAMTPPEIKDNSFGGLYATVTVSVPADAFNDYIGTNWGLFENFRLGDSDKISKTFETGNLKYRLSPVKSEEGKNLAVVMPGDYSALTEVTIPERITYSDNGSNERYYVDAIGYKAFNGCSNLTTVTFNSRNAARTICGYAFAGTNISAITMPKTIESIGDHAFSKCSSLSSVEIPGSVRTIGDYAFYKTQNLGKVTFNGGLESIGDYAFSECSLLSSVEIPGSVRTIGDYAFYETRNLGKVTFNEGLESIGERAFSAYSDRNVEPIYIPSTLKSVVKDAFFNFNCRYVNISDLASWCNIDFANSNSNPAAHRKGLYLNGEIITDLVIPESVKAVKDYTFCYNNELDSVTFNESLQTIGASAFEGCIALESLIFNEGLQSISDKAFYNCNAISSLILPNSLSTIGQQAFYGEKSMKNLTIGTSLTECNADSFEGCNFDNLIITDGLTKLRFSGEWDKVGIHNLYMGRPIEFVTSEN